MDSKEKIWEDFICIGSGLDKSFDVLGPASMYEINDERLGWWKDLDYKNHLSLDTFPLPLTKDRENYFGEHHFSYWASGLKDVNMIFNAASEYGINTPKAYLDLGCASGRILRHTAIKYPSMKSIGCDINRSHIEWCNNFLPSQVVVFQNSSIPALPIESNSIDLVTAFSVFTHIEAMETSWLMELRRILRPGGMAWITVHTENTLKEMDESWPLWKPVMHFPMANKLFDLNSKTFEGNRLNLRYRNDTSYSANVFYKEEYIRKFWGRIFKFAELRRRCPSYQDVAILIK
jgi:ubiquinone/menaquinone biosynthesis C-methylase UbiE